MRMGVSSVDLRVLNMRTRMPFKYGIATLTAVPHLFLTLSIDIDGHEQLGIAPEGLPPKWFTKNPDTSFRDDLTEMFDVIKAACTFALKVGECPTVFDLWWRTYDLQRQWAQETSYPPLLWAFGVTLVERAVIDAFCRATGSSFASAVRRNTFGIELGRIHRELDGKDVADLLPTEPRQSIKLRHTVGLLDPLTDDDIPPKEKLDDGLPQSLEACMNAYGLTHYKIKITNDADATVERLTSVAKVVQRGRRDFNFSLDGNESFWDVGSFRSSWERLESELKLSAFLQRLLFVEQPFHRDVAWDEDLARALGEWKTRPPIIIDESDGELDSLIQALEAGYVGTSHKNCKGVFKGIVNAALLEHYRRKETADLAYVLSGEDLGNVGPISQCQDLTVMATLGIDHVERNGHHYFRGLSMYPEAVQDQFITLHGDLYERGSRGFATLKIQNGLIALGSLVEAPFGVAVPFDAGTYTPLHEWTFQSLES